MDGGKSYSVAGYDKAGAEVLRASGKDESDALTALVNGHYNKSGDEVFRRQQWRCAWCDKYRPLQRHHIKERAKGRDDRAENLVGLCAECHRLATESAVHRQAIRNTFTDRKPNEDDGQVLLEF